MRRWFFRTVAVAVALTVGACGEEASHASDTRQTTADLLAGIPQGSSSQMGDANLPPAPTQTIGVESLGYNRGSGESPVRVVEMSDYGCGFCRQFHMETFPTVLVEFIESGKVEWKFLPFITGMFGNSLVATEAAECSLAQSPEVFERLNERLWTNQSDWKRSGEPETVVRTMAEEAGADLDDFDACLADDRRMERISAATSLAQEMGVRGTPTFFILGYPPIQGALPTEVFQEILTAVHSEATQAGGG